MKLRNLRKFDYMQNDEVAIFSYLLRDRDTNEPKDLSIKYVSKYVKIFDSIDNEKFIIKLMDKYIKDNYSSELIYKIYDILKLKLTKEEENAKINLLIIEN